MGSRNLDRRSFATFCPDVETVADLARYGWKVRTRCISCALELEVSLKAVARVLGPGASLWNRQPRCQRTGCIGRVRYLGSPPGTYMFWALTDAERFRKDGLQMCNRYRASWAWREATGEFSEARLPLRFPSPDQAPNLQPLDVRPTNMAFIARPLDPAEPGRGLGLVRLRWDLVPWFHRGTLKAKRYLCTNARSETVHRANSFSRPFERRRCLIPASAWYEWTGPKASKVQWRFTVPRRPMFCFAGLWEHAETADGTVESFTMLTTAAGEDGAPYHDRQPVVLAREDYARWLDLGADVRPLYIAPPAGTFAVEKMEKIAE